MTINRFSLAVLAILLICSACGGPSPNVTAEPGSPTHAMQSLLKAIAEEDVELYVSLLDAKARSQVERARKAMPDQFESMIKSQIGKFKHQWTGLEVVGEELNGNKAKVTISKHQGNTIDVDFIREPEGWKLRLLS